MGWEAEGVLRLKLFPLSLMSCGRGWRFPCFPDHMLCRTSSSTTLILLLVTPSVDWRSNSEERTNRSTKRGGGKWEARASITQLKSPTKPEGNVTPAGFLQGRIFLLLRAAHEEHTQIHPSPSTSAGCFKCCLLWLLEAIQPCPH